MTYGNGNSYQGKWANDEKVVGKYIWEDTGNSYQGQWVNNKKDGQGTFTKGSTGGSYKGGWKQDKMDGKGKIITKAGKETPVTYENGVLKYKDGPVVPCSEAE
eukprot:661350_1